MKRGPKSKALQPFSDKDMQKQKDDQKQQGKDADKKRKSLILCDDTQQKPHKASNFNTDNIHTAFFEAKQEVMHWEDLSSQITKKIEQKERELQKQKIDLMHKNQEAPVASSAVAQQEEYERQCQQVKNMNYCERRHLYRKKLY